MTDTHGQSLVRRKGPRHLFFTGQFHRFRNDHNPSAPYRSPAAYVTPEGGNFAEAAEVR